MRALEYFSSCSLSQQPAGITWGTQNETEWLWVGLIWWCLPSMAHQNPVPCGSSTLEVEGRGASGSSLAT